MNHQVSTNSSSLLPRIAGLPVEFDLLLCCTRANPDRWTSQRITEIIKRGINWPSLIGLATGHGLLPLLYHNLQTSASDLVPPDQMEKLEDTYRASAWQSLYLSEELIRLLEIFETRKISVIPYKGPVLGASVYGDLTLRPFGDLDLLIRRQDATRAKEALVANGYQALSNLTRKLEKGYHCSFKRTDGQIPVELHWALTVPSFLFHLDFDHLEQNLQQISVLDTKLSSLALEDLLLYSCFHSAKHALIPGNRLIWLNDVAELVRTQRGLNWEQLLARANQTGTQRVLFVELLVAANLLEAPLPDHIRRQAQSDVMAGFLAARMPKRLFPPGNSAAQIINRHLFRLLVRERWRERRAYLLYLLSPNAKDEAQMELPESLALGYHGLRLVRVARNYGLQAFKSWRNRR